MKIIPSVARAAMEKNLITEEKVAAELGIKLKSARSLLRAEASTSRNQVIKLCALLKVSFKAMEPETK
jgi:hypothetical protein